MGVRARRTRLAAGSALALGGALLIASVSTSGEVPQPVGSPSPGQSAPRQPQEATEPPQLPPFRVEATYVRVDAYVTEDGEPVRDLTVDDFEILEDGVLQSIEQFELVEVRPAGPQATRREPRTVAESRDMAADPRARVFVLYLDVYHIGLAGAHNVRRALANSLDRIIGPDDLIGVMTPYMSAADVTLARRTDTIEALLERWWEYGLRDQPNRRDPEEDSYEMCYPEVTPGVSCRLMGREVEEPANFYAGIAREMVERRRESLALAGLSDLVTWLRGVREERKAVLVVSDGWQLFRPNHALTRRSPCEPPPEIPAPRTDPTGRLGVFERDRGPFHLSKAQCELDRQRLSQADIEQDYHDLLDRANRSNVTFYPIDPRGLPAWDTSLGESVSMVGGGRRPFTVEEDRRRLTTRNESLRSLATATDGVAVVNSNDLKAGLRRVVADLTTYYLFGYYSTNDALDGSFRRITVRVKRPGVEVRARRGYRAATPGELGTSAPSTEAPDAEAVALSTALGTLAAMRPDVRIKTHAAWAPGPSGGTTVFVTLEVDPAAMVRTPELAGGGDLSVTLSDGTGRPLGETAARLAAGGRLATLTFETAALSPGELVVRSHFTPQAGGLPFADVTRVPVDPSSAAHGSARLFRRGPATANRFEPTADLRFRRAERFRVELPIGPGAETAADLLDRDGKALAVPVTTNVRDDNGHRWAVAEVALAPLAAGEYVLRLTVERSGASERLLTPLRVVP